MNLHVFENSAARAPSELVTAPHDTAFAARVATGDGGASDATVSDKDAADRPSPVIARGDPFAGLDGEDLFTGLGAVISGSDGRPDCGNFIEPAEHAPSPSDSGFLKADSGCRCKQSEAKGRGAGTRPGGDGELGAAFTEAGACTGLGGGGDDSDEQLVLRVQFGDGEALALLRARYCGLLQSQALRLLRSPEEADDVVSEVFIEVWQRASCYHREWARAVAWLITLVRRRAIDRLRVRQRQRKIEAGLSQKQLSCAPDGGSPVEEEMRLGEIRAVLESALSRLPEEQGRAVWMAYYKGFSQKEISKITKAPVGTVKTRLEIGLRKMRQRLSRDESVLNALRGAGTGRASPRARSATGGRLEAEELARGGEDHAGCEGTAEGGDSAGEVR